jgi:hypothetical protein
MQTMNGQQFKVVRGVVSDLRVQQDEKDFVFSSGDKAAGGVAAMGLALGGLAGAATGVALSAGNTAEQIDFFSCKVGDRFVRGKFGEVSFINGDSVEVVGLLQPTYFDAYAITRPSDRTIWMYPHCGRGSLAYLRFSAWWIGIVAWLLSPTTMFAFLWFASEKEDVMPPTWLFFAIWLSVGAISSVIFIFVASRFRMFAGISNRIFAALGFDNPTKVDLHERLRESGKTFSNVERLNYHPHARWVYKY